jgi:hypothetical protein
MQPAAACHFIGLHASHRLQKICFVLLRTASQFKRYEMDACTVPFIYWCRSHVVPVDAGFLYEKLPCPFLWRKRHPVPLISTECCMWVWLWHTWFIWLMEDLRFWQCSWQFKSSGMLRRVDWYLLIDISKYLNLLWWYLRHSKCATKCKKKVFLTSWTEPVIVSVLEQSFRLD